VITNVCVWGVGGDTGSDDATVTSSPWQLGRQTDRQTNKQTDRHTSTERAEPPKTTAREEAWLTLGTRRTTAISGHKQPVYRDNHAAYFPAGTGSGICCRIRRFRSPWRRHIRSRDASVAQSLHSSHDFFTARRVLSCLFLSVNRSVWFHYSWPTFSSYLYNRVQSELTCCNSLAWLVHAWVDTSGYPMVMELSQLDHCLLWITLATTLVYPTVDSGLTITSTLLSSAAPWQFNPLVHTPSVGHWSNPTPLRMKTKLLLGASATAFRQFLINSTSALLDQELISYRYSSCLSSCWATRLKKAQCSIVSIQIRMK